MRRADQRLLVEVWDVAPDGSGLTLLSDSGDQPGNVGEVRLAALDPGRVVTAVRAEDDRLKLIVRNVDAAGGVVRGATVATRRASPR